MLVGNNNIPLIIYFKSSKHRLPLMGSNICKILLFNLIC